MRVKKTCAVCGKVGEIEIDDETREIKSDWCYFGVVETGRGKCEYWECPECCKQLEDAS